MEDAAVHQRVGELDRAERQIVVPLGLRVEVERNGGEQVAVRVQVGQGEDALAGAQAAGGEARLAPAKDLEAEPER
ncbi:MAG: hypothetical protein ACRDNK_06595 [Solirubrobacteraceae bacterium]